MLTTADLFKPFRSVNFSKITLVHRHPEFVFWCYSFTVDKLTAEKVFVVDLSVTLCIDGTCTPINLLHGARVPIPICNANGTFSLPGDGTIAGYLDTLTGGITDAAVDLVFESLGLKVYLMSEFRNGKIVK